MLEKLKIKTQSLWAFITPTKVDMNQLQTNIKNEFLSTHLKRVIDMLEKHTDYIGKEVHRYEKTQAVITIDEYKQKTQEDATFSMFNPIHKTGFIFTKSHYDSFQEWYIEHQIKYLSNDLLSRSIYLHSTNPSSNLKHEWITESKQYLIEFFKELLDDNRIQKGR